MRKKSFILFILIIMMATFPVSAQEKQEKQLFAFGDGHTIVYEGLLNSIIDHKTNGIAKILLLPVANSYDPDSVTENSRYELLKFAESHRDQLQEACNLRLEGDISCLIQIVTILSRSDANSDDYLNVFSADLDAIIILGDDPKSTMQVIADTKLEQFLLQSYERGTIISGIGAGGSILSKTMLAGFHQNHSHLDALNFGAIDLWNGQQERGLIFGLESAILDLEVFQSNRFTRLLNAISLPEAPHIGVGIDEYTGVKISGGKIIEETIGMNVVTIVDAETYHSAKGVQYWGSNYIISLRNLLVHLYAAGDYSYNLETRQSTLADAPEIIARSFSELSKPDQAGVLIVGGNLEHGQSRSSIITRFLNYSGGLNAKIAIVASGYSSDVLAKEAANQYVKSFQNVESILIIVPQKAVNPIILPDDITGIMLIGGDPSTIQPSLLQPAKDAWLQGATILADDAAAAVIGKYYSTQPLSSIVGEQNGVSLDGPLLLGQTSFSQGLSFIDAMFEPQMSSDNRWKSLFSLAYYDPTTIVFGICENAVIEFTNDGIFVRGDNGVFVLDISYAQLGPGENQGYIFANGLLDVFAPGELVHPSIADAYRIPISLPTPILSVTPAIFSSVTAPTASITLTSTIISPTPTLTITPRFIPTRTPRPTNTPPAIPPASDPGRSNFMISFLLIVVCIVFLGVWLNRQKIV